MGRALQTSLLLPQATGARRRKSVRIPGLDEMVDYPRGGKVDCGIERHRSSIAKTDKQILQRPSCYARLAYMSELRSAVVLQY